MRETDADATGTNQFDVTGIFCGKLSRCPVRDTTDRVPIKEHRANTRLFTLSTVKPHGGMAALQSAFGHGGERTHRKYRHRFSVLTESGPAARRLCGAFPQAGAPRGGLRSKPSRKRKDPSGGTTGRVKPYGALGVDGRSRRIQPMGRDYRSHIDKSQQARRTFKTSGDFFNFFIPRFRRLSRGFTAENPGKITASRGDWGRLPQICPTPSRAQGHSMLCSRKRYCDRALFPRQADRKPRRRAPKPGRSRP